jgi:hypothetical protein
MATPSLPFDVSLGSHNFSPSLVCVMACAWWCACSTVEDTDTTFEELKREFGLKVADIVREVTDDKSMAKDVRTTDLAH